MSVMPQLILFLGVQLSGKSALAQKIAEIKKMPLVSIDKIRLELYGQLSGPKDWVNEDSVVLHNNQTRTAYDRLFEVMRSYLNSGRSLVVEMPHLGDRENQLKEIVAKAGAEIKIIWCYISQDSDEEIQKRINSRPENAAPVRLEDYRMFKSKIKKPKVDSLVVDTSLPLDKCLCDIINHIETKIMPSITVIVPAYKKAKILESFVSIVVGALEKLNFNDYEIFIITNPNENGVDDETPAVARALASNSNRIKTIHNRNYVNVGFKYRQGVKLATKEYVTCIFCDSEVSERTVMAVLSHIGEADVILSYTANMESRTLFRRILSRTFTRLCNFIYHLQVTYYNGTSIYPRALLQSLDLKNDSFAYNVEAFVSAQKFNSKLTYKEVPVILNQGKTSGAAFKINNVIGIGKTLLRLFWRVWFQRRHLIKRA